MKKKHKPQSGAFGGKNNSRNSLVLTRIRESALKKLKTKKSLKAPKRLVPG